MGPPADHPIVWPPFPPELEALMYRPPRGGGIADAMGAQTADVEVPTGPQPMLVFGPRPASTARQRS